jgi:uncharacterized membrane protein YedE/YeeE
MSWTLPLLGGALIGSGAVLLMALAGRVAGISGILGAVLPPAAEPDRWRLAFLAGLVAAPPLLALGLGVDPLPVPPGSLPLLGVAGLLVGLGAGLGGGCTSGHGVCGLARLSPRSLAATVTFMASGLGTVFVIRHLL